MHPAHVFVISSNQKDILILRPLVANATETFGGVGQRYWTFVRPILMRTPRTERGQMIVPPWSHHSRDVARGPEGRGQGGTCWNVESESYHILRFTSASFCLLCETTDRIGSCYSVHMRLTLSRTPEVLRTW